LPNEGRIISVNVGMSQELGRIKGRAVISCIFKKPSSGRVTVTKLGLEGDSQADLAVHGGEMKAVYIYPSEHYAYWRNEFPGMEMPWGSFGENLTTEGLSEGKLHVGDRLRAGTASFSVTQPRLPCYKLGMRFGSAKVVDLFLKGGRTGFYLRVLKEGAVGAGDAIDVGQGDRRGLPVSSVARSVAEDA
jgi:MOSC domain-containing protein YiiM